MSTLSRRSIVTSAAALPALSVPAIASTEPDPIFAAIQALRNSEAIFNAVPDEDEDQNDKAFDAFYEANCALFRTVPTTAAGAVALMRFVEEQVERNGGDVGPLTLLIDHRYTDDADENDSARRHQAVHYLLASLRTAFERLSGEV